MSALSVVLSTRVGRRRKFGEVSCTECIGQGNDFELILTAEMETINPAEGYFGSKFPAICNHCSCHHGGHKSQDVKKILEIFAFLEKRPLTVKFVDGLKSQHLENV